MTGVGLHPAGVTATDGYPTGSGLLTAAAPTVPGVPVRPEPGAAGRPGRGGDDDLCRLVVSCADQPGIVAAITTFLTGRGANIVSLDQYSTDAGTGQFFLRITFRLGDLEQTLPDLTDGFRDEVARRFRMQARFRPASVIPGVAIFVSRYDHCLLDLLWRWRRGDLPIDISLVISNHPDLRAAVEQFGVRFEHIPVQRGRKAAAEARQLEMLNGAVDLLVLARYMQILSGDMLRALEMPAINIHHSFLPAFAGASPYVRAGERGVKLIGATAHYVTEELDEGPIIEQDVIRVTHRADVAELARLGADIERTVLARAVEWHCTERVLVSGRKTVVF